MASGRCSIRSIMISEMKASLIYAFLLGGVLTPLCSRAQLPQPEVEGWESEAFHEAVGEVLKDFGKVILCEGDMDELSEFCRKDAVASPLRPGGDRAETIGGIAVRRGVSSEEAAPLQKRIVELLSAYSEGRATRVKFKIHHVEPGEKRSEQFVSITGRAADGRLVEQNLNWRIDWQGVWLERG